MSAPFEVINSGGRGLPRVPPDASAVKRGCSGRADEAKREQAQIDREQEAAQRHQAQIDRERDATEKHP
ncbi:MAG TPA: hypothetical protein VIZ70_03765 [Propionibacteriaceae bacterium]|jgi:hypothetical protein